MPLQVTRVQDRGRITLPRTIREKFHLKQGAFVAFVETEKGVVIQPAEAFINAGLDAICEELLDQGITLEDLIEQGRKVRGDLLQEFYGIRPSRNKGKK